MIRKQKYQKDLVARFIQHALSSPNKIAIQTSEHCLTYHKLYQEVCKLCEFFRENVKTKAVVCLDRTPNLLAALLALQWLKITYIPVEPSIPLARLRIIIEDSRADTLLYDDAFSQDASSLPCKKYDLTKVALNNKEEKRYKSNQASNPAYIIYT